MSVLGELEAAVATVDAEQNLCSGHCERRDSYEGAQDGPPLLASMSASSINLFSGLGPGPDSWIAFSLSTIEPLMVEAVLLALQTGSVEKEKDRLSVTRGA